MKKIKHKANESEREETMINPRGGFILRACSPSRRIVSPFSQKRTLQKSHVVQNDQAPVQSVENTLPDTSPEN